MKLQLSIGIAALVVVGAIAGWQQYKSDDLTNDTSAAAATKGSIRLAYDSWLGYVPLTSKHMKRGMRQRGYNLVTVNDQADYAERFKLLSKGKYDAVVASLDGALLESEQWKFPGVIPFVLDVSSGGDKVVSRCSDVKDVDQLKKSGVIAYTPDSPSHHFVKSMVVNFGFDKDRFKKDGTWAKHTTNVKEAYLKLTNGDVNTAVLWEPYVSAALKDKDMCAILGTENTANLIVDVLLINRSFLRDKPEAVKSLTRQYFTTLKYYMKEDNKSAFYKEIKREISNLDNDEIEAALKGVKFVNLTENCEQWIGCNEQGEALVDTIESTINILTKYGDFDNNPLPDENAYTMINRSIAEEVFASGISGESGAQEQTDPLTKQFSKMNDAQWKKLKVVGSLPPIVFSASSKKLGIESKKKIDLAVENLKGYPNFRVKIQGHTSNRGDAAANKTLSHKRAKSVARYLEITYGVDPNRIKVEGFGGSKPLEKKSNESMRAWRYRLSRVELILVTELY